jgi:hypothetical protein
VVPSVGLKKIEVATASVGDLGMVGSSGGKPFSQEKGDMQPTTMRIQLDLMGYTVYSIYIYTYMIMMMMMFVYACKNNYSPIGLY